MRCCRFLKGIKAGTLPNLVFPDKELFVVEAKVNPRNDRLLSSDIGSLPTEGQKPSSVMVQAAASSESKLPLVFVDPRAKVNSEYYTKRILKEGLFPGPNNSLKRDIIFESPSSILQLPTFTHQS